MQDARQSLRLGELWQVHANILLRPACTAPATTAGPAAGTAPIYTFHAAAAAMWLHVFSKEGPAAVYETSLR
jgi:hypothetical protein